MSKKAFGELELSVLQVLKAKGRTTVREVHKTLGEANKYTTIMTVMSRLVEKKIVAREKMGLQYEYWMLEDSPKIPSLIQQFKQKFLGIKTATLMSYLINEAEDTSDEDLLEMEMMIQEAKKKRDNSTKAFNKLNPK